MRKRKNGISLVLTGGLAACALWLNGCQMTGRVEPEPEPPPSAISQAVATLDQMKHELHATLAALDLLEKSAANNPRSAFGDFSSALNRFERRVEQHRNKLWAIEANSYDSYLQWERELYGISDPLVRVKEPEKRAQAKRSYDEILAELKKAKDQAAALTSDLRDLRAFLANDLSAAGVASASDLIAKVRKGASDLLSQIEAAINTVLKAKLAAAPVPTRPVRLEERRTLPSGQPL